MSLPLPDSWQSHLSRLFAYNGSGSYGSSHMKQKIVTLKDYLNTHRNARALKIIGPMQIMKKQIFRDPVVFVDGGTRHQKSFGFSVGDGDSSLRVLNTKLPAEKDYSDLAYVLKNVPSTFTHVELWGFSGGRLDHELCNLGELFSFLKSRSKTQLSVDLHLRVYAPGRWSIKVPRGIFSVFSLRSANFQITGRCKYKLPKAKRITPMSSHLLSNKSSGICYIAADQAFFVWSEREFGFHPI